MHKCDSLACSRLSMPFMERTAMGAFKFNFSPAMCLIRGLFEGLPRTRYSKKLMDFDRLIQRADITILQQGRASIRKKCEIPLPLPQLIEVPSETYYKCRAKRLSTRTTSTEYCDDREYVPPNTAANTVGSYPHCHQIERSEYYSGHVVLASPSSI